MRRLNQREQPSVRSAMRLVLCLCLASSTALSFPASSAEFAAAIGRKGYGRCHAYYCGFFTIDYVMPVGSGPDGTLYSISQHTWAKAYSDEAGDKATQRETEKVRPYASLVYCSKARPVVFDYFNGWQAISLRPGDDGAVSGRTESALQFYFAACHNAIVQTPNPPGLAKRLGYSFAKTDGGGGDEDDKLTPADLLRPATSPAATPSKGVESCTKMKKAVERLTCYDSASGYSD